MPTTLTLGFSGSAAVVVVIEGVDIPLTTSGRYSYKLDPPIQLQGSNSCTLEQGGANPSANAAVQLLELKGTVLTRS